VYGAPWLSGYGTLGDLYSRSYLTTNLRQFVGWLVETQTPLVALALVYLVVPRLVRDSTVARPRWLLGGFIAAVWLSYVFYLPFDAWWYLRFLLPAWPVMLLIVAAVIDETARRVAGARAAPAIALTAIVLLAGNGLRVAVDRFAFDIGR